MNKLLAVLLVAASPLAAAATRLQVSMPSTVLAGTPVSITVTAVDAGGATDPSYRGTVQVTSDATGNFPPPYTYTAADAGVHTFTATFTSPPANATVLAADNGNPAISGTAQTLVTGPGGIVRFRVDAPSQVTRTVPFNVTVTAVTNSGATATGYTGTVRFSGTFFSLPPDYTFTPGDAGTHVFSVTAIRGGSASVSLRDTQYLNLIGSSDLIAIVCSGFTVSAINTGPVCPGSTVTLSAQTTQQNVTFEWNYLALPKEYPYFHTGQVVPNAEVPHNGAQWEVLMYDASTSCQARSITTVSWTGRRVTTDASGNNIYTCAATYPVHITNDDPADPYTNIQWQVTSGGATIASGQGTTTATFAFPAGSTGAFGTVTATTASGCNSSTDFYVNHSDPPSVTFTSVPSNVCPGQQVTVEYEFSGGGFTYTDANCFHLSSATVTHGTVGNSGRTYTGTSMKGTTIVVPDGTGDMVLTVAGTSTCRYPCTGGGQVVIPVNATAASVVPATTKICSGETATIQATVGGKPPLSVMWSDGVQQTATSNSVSRTVSPTSDTSYSIVSVTGAGACTAPGNGTATVLVDRVPTITEQPRSQAVAAGTSVDLLVQVDTTATVAWYQGAVGDRSKQVASTFSFHTPALNATTIYWAEVSTKCGSAKSQAAVITVGAPEPGRRRAVRH
jgi:hypothetical protein